MSSVTEILMTAMFNAITWFSKGEWLENATYYLMKAYEVIKFLAYLASILVLLGLAVLSIGTIVYLFMDAIDSPLTSFQFIHDVTEKVVNNTTAWAAFIVLVANITFIHRSRSNDLQRAALSLQEDKWHYEKSKIMDEHHAYQAEQRNKYHPKGHAIGMGNITSRPDLNRPVDSAMLKKPAK